MKTIIASPQVFGPKSYRQVLTKLGGHRLNAPIPRSLEIDVKVISEVLGEVFVRNLDKDVWANVDDDYQTILIGAEQ